MCSPRQQRIRRVARRSECARTLLISTASSCDSSGCVYICALHRNINIATICRPIVRCVEDRAPRLHVDGRSCCSLCKTVRAVLPRARPNTLAVHSTSSAARFIAQQLTKSAHATASENTQTQGGREVHVVVALPVLRPQAIFQRRPCQSICSGDRVCTYHAIGFAADISAPADMGIPRCFGAPPELTTQVKR